jgi:hypothetical protein
MKRNWKLLQEILEFLTLSKDCKIERIGDSMRNDQGNNCILIKDKYYIQYEKLLDPERNPNFFKESQTHEFKLKLDCLLSNSDSFVWERRVLDYHVDLLVEIKAVKLIIEDIEETIDKTKWEEGYYDYCDYDELIADRLFHHIPCKGIYKDVEFYQLTWLGIEMLDILTKMEEDGVNLFELDTPHPTILKYINPLINKANKMRLATLQLK